MIPFVSTPDMGASQRSAGRLTAHARRSKMSIATATGTVAGSIGMAMNSRSNATARPNVSSAPRS